MFLVSRARGGACGPSAAPERPVTFGGGHRGSGDRDSMLGGGRTSVVRRRPRATSTGAKPGPPNVPMPPPAARHGIPWRGKTLTADVTCRRGSAACPSTAIRSGRLVRMCRGCLPHLRGPRLTQPLVVNRVPFGFGGRRANRYSADRHSAAMKFSRFDLRAFLNARVHPRAELSVESSMFVRYHLEELPTRWAIIQ